MLKANEFAKLLRLTGTPWTWTQAKAPHQAAAVTAIVGALTRADEPIINAFGITGVSVQIAANAIPLPPEKFDSFKNVDGVEHVVNTVVPHEERSTGNLVSYTLYCRGK